MKKFNVRKFRVNTIKMAITACTIALAVMNGMAAYAENADNTAPDGTGGTTTMNSIVNVIFWIVRAAILGIGGIPAILKIVQGQTDENPRDRNAGLAALVITAFAFGATFLIKGLII